MNNFSSREEQEEKLKKLIAGEDTEGILELLKHPAPGFDIDTPDESGCSPLYIALAKGLSKKNPRLISLLTAHGAAVKNGSILPPKQPAKLLTLNASAAIIRQVFRYCFDHYGTALFQDVILEVGSGDGYLKYLLSLITRRDQVIETIKNRLAETEPAPGIVSGHLLKGKHVIDKGISQLAGHFGAGFTSCVVGLNVMDTFSRGELIANMGVVHRLLKEKGIFLHIMSSSIHRAIFREIENEHPGAVFFPYFEDGLLGLRIAADNMPFIRQIKSAHSLPDDLCGLFIDNPMGFIEIAGKVTGIFNQSKTPGPVILFKDFFIKKIQDAFEKTGFKRVYQEEVSAVKIVPGSRFHRQVAGGNYFENRLGLITTDNIIMDGPAKGRVVEKSTFLVIIGQKVQ